MQISCQQGAARRDLKRDLSPGIDQPFGANAVGRISAGEEGFPRGQRVLDGLSGVRTEEWLGTEGWLEVTETVLNEMRKSDAAMIP